jgi:hypothetical protein
MYAEIKMTLETHIAICKYKKGGMDGAETVENGSYGDSINTGSGL